MSIEGLRSIPTSEYSDIPKVVRARENRKRNNRDLARHAGDPVRIFYPAGRWDMESLTMPSVEVLAIVDLVPLLFSEEKPGNTYSAPIYRHLETNNGYINLLQFFNNNFLLPDQQKEFTEKVKASYNNQAWNIAENSAYEPVAEKRIDQVRTDSFAEVLGGLLFWGADPETIQVGKFGNDFRIQFDLDGKRKTAIFRQVKIDADFGREGSDNYQWAQTCFDEFEEGPTALLIKADLHRVSKHVVNAVKPDVIMGNCSVTTEIEFLFKDSYQFFDDVSLEFYYPDQAWGGKKIKDIRLGRKMLVSA